MTTWIPVKGDKQASTSQGKPNASNEESSFKLFSDLDIMIATNNLSEESMIGRGGFGIVYKGTIDNAEVAIKFLDAKSTATKFIREMTVLENLKHENLVKLMGACLELRALVYELLPRGSLEDCLNNSSLLLTWRIRVRIVYEICSVLMFLHSMKPKPMVHGDLKPQNILLDADLHCRLSNFGLCRFLPEFSETTGAYLQTKSISGTECYIDPDFLEHGKLTPGCDVFSFGVTILRILTGLRPRYIYRKIRKASRSNSLMTIVDYTAGDWPVEVAEYLAKSGLDCYEENKNNLKIMTELSTFLENLAEKGCFEMSRKCQPDLVVEVPRVLEPTMKMTTWIPVEGDKQASTSQGKPNASNEESSLKLFTKSAIMNATNNLSKESMIGSGGFGNVYKGTIDNAEVAIKILDAKSTQGEKEFFQEMTVLEDLKHENLVKLMGVCLKQRALVYEFLPRGSLEDCLNKCPQLLTWQIRTRIVYEICSVLMFLHSMKPKPVVHGDLKPHNILLDADLHCRLSDFGLCRFLPEFSETTGAYLQTMTINGTECYMDPYYVLHGKLTPGCDVFSFGVTILRILTGQRPLKIRTNIREAIRSNSLMRIVDSTAGDWPVEVAKYLAKSGLDCSKRDRNNVNIMTELSAFLENYICN